VVQAADRAPSSRVRGAWLQGHWLACGPNEVGKTTLVKRLLAEIEQLTVLDTKLAGEFTSWPRMKHTVDAAKIARATGRVVYHAPPGVDWSNPELDDFFAGVWARGNNIAVVDEAGHACTAGGIPRNYRSCLRSGRGRGIAVVTLAQRLVGLHNDALSESWTYVLFAPITGTDPAKAREFGVGEAALDWLADPSRKMHDFLVWSRRERRIIYQYEAKGAKTA